MLRCNPNPFRLTGGPSAVSRIVVACALLSIALVTALPASAKLICVRNAGADSLGIRAGHSMFWLDGGHLRCFRTDEDLATLQNWDVQQCEERDIAVDLREHACLIAVGSDGVCVPELETRQLADACRQ